MADAIYTKITIAEKSINCKIRMNRIGVVEREFVRLLVVVLSSVLPRLLDLVNFLWVMFFFFFFLDLFVNGLQI